MNLLETKINEQTKQNLIMLESRYCGNKIAGKKILDPAVWSKQSNHLSREDILLMDYLRFRNYVIRENMNGAKFLPEK